MLSIPGGCPNEAKTLARRKVMSDVKATFDKIQERFHNEPDKLGDLSAVYLFKLTGDEAGDWTIRVESGKGTVEESAADDATCTITIADSDFVSMVKGDSNPQMLFMTGKLKVSGDMGQALKLQKVLG